MALDDVYVLTVSARITGGIVQNSLAFLRTSATEPVTADFAAVAVDVKDLIRTQQTNTMTYESWKARQVRGANVTWPSSGKCNPIGGHLFEGTFTTNLPGGSASDALPPQCALVVTLRTSEVGRRRRGRFYHGGMIEANQANGVWNSSVLTPLETAWAAFFTKYAVVAPVSNFRLGIWSFRTASGCVARPTGGGHDRIDPPDPAAAFEDCTSYTIRSTVFTQRRRVAGVGR